jgi:uncharacterized protein (DUF2147 family)
MIFRLALNGEAQWEKTVDELMEAVDFCFVSVAFLLLCGPLGAIADPSPAGLWKTFDDRTHKPRGIVRIYESDGAFAGRIESSFDPKDRNEVCDKCRDDRRNAPVIGLEILRGMRQHGSEYTGGDILDPETGSVYKCKMMLSPDGDKLQVRGYLGLSLLGRTQTWIRVRS